MRYGRILIRRSMQEESLSRWMAVIGGSSEGSSQPVASSQPPLPLHLHPPPRPAPSPPPPPPQPLQTLQTLQQSQTPSSIKAVRTRPTQRQLPKSTASHHTTLSNPPSTSQNQRTSQTTQSKRKKKEKDQTRRNQKKERTKMPPTKQELSLLINPLVPESVQHNNRVCLSFFHFILFHLFLSFFFQRKRKGKIQKRTSLSYLLPQPHHSH